MSTFKIVEGDYVIISFAGLFKQVPLAERDGILYASVSGGFVQLRADGGTSKAGVRLVEVSFDEPLHQTTLGKLCRRNVEGSVMLPGEKALLLLAGPA